MIFGGGKKRQGTHLHIRPKGRTRRRRALTRHQAPVQGASIVMALGDSECPTHRPCTKWQMSGRQILFVCCFVLLLLFVCVCLFVCLSICLFVVVFVVAFGEGGHLASEPPYRNGDDQGRTVQQNKMR